MWLKESGAEGRRAQQGLRRANINAVANTRVGEAETSRKVWAQTSPRRRRRRRQEDHEQHEDQESRVCRISGHDSRFSPASAGLKDGDLILAHDRIPPVGKSTQSSRPALPRSTFSQMCVPANRGTQLNVTTRTFNFCLCLGNDSGLIRWIFL